MADAAGEHAGTDGESVDAGDVVTVSGDDAVVELAWSDGAVTRLGPGTVFTVGDPQERLGSRGTQAGGVSWNRLAADEAADQAPYVLDVDGSDPVSDRGELFVVDCRSGQCRAEGTGGSGGDGSKTTFRRGQVETAVVGGAPVAWAVLMSDPWSQQNAALDEEGGWGTVADLFADAEPSRGLLEGTFDVFRTGRERTCTGEMCSQLVLLSPGETRELVFTFHLDCADPTGCASTVDTQSINTNDGTPIDSTVPLVTGAETFTWGTDDERAACLLSYEDGTTGETGRGLNSIRWSVTPTKAEIRDGAFVVTELRGETQSSLTILEHVSPEFPGCAPYEMEWAGVSDLVLTKRED